MGMVSRGLEALEAVRANVIAPVLNAAIDNPASAAGINTRDCIRDVSNSPGAAPLHAFIRQGADEIAQALVALPDSNIRPQAEPGQLFEVTPGMVDRQYGHGQNHEHDMDMDH